MGHDKPPPLLMQKCPNGFLPYGALSREIIDAALVGQVYTCTPRRGRTLPRNGAYWAGLNAAVKATDAWPTAGHLHEDLKRLCGYVDIYHNPLTGRDEIRPQSTAFDKMPEAEFAHYFALAQSKFIAKIGFDPWKRDETSTEMGD
jgi:hypothetical protein